MYKCKYFVLKELVHPDVLKRVPESTLWMLFDDRVLKCADMIREKYGPCTINASGLVDCGLRDFESKTGAKYSAHVFGRALDMHIRSIELQFAGNPKGKAQAYNKIRSELMSDRRFDCLNFEKSDKAHPDGITWLHISTDNRPNRLFVA